MMKLNTRQEDYQAILKVVLGVYGKMKVTPKVITDLEESLNQALTSWQDLEGVPGSIDVNVSALYDRGLNNIKISLSASFIDWLQQGEFA